MIVRLLVVTIGAFVLAGCASSDDDHTTTAGTKSLVTIPLHAQQTNIVEAYDILHRLGFRVELTHSTSLADLRSLTVKLSPPPGTRIPRGSVVKIAPGFGLIATPQGPTSHRTSSRRSAGKTQAWRSTGHRGTKCSGRSLGYQRSPQAMRRVCSTPIR